MLDITDYISNTGTNPDGRQWWDIISPSSGHTYRVTEGKRVEFHSKRWECDCPHYRYRLKDAGGKCKHICLCQALLACIEEEAA